MIPTCWQWLLCVEMKINKCTKMNLTPGKSLFLKMSTHLSSAGSDWWFSNCVPENPRISLDLPDSPSERRSEGRESKSLSPYLPFLGLRSFYLLAITLYTVLLSGILFVVKFPWLQRTFKTNDLDDPQEPLRRNFLIP